MIDPKTIPPDVVEAAIRELDNPAAEEVVGFAEDMRAAIAAALEAWKPSWIETEFDNAGVIISRHYVLDITPEENPND